MSVSAISAQSLNIDNLLNEIAKKTDLSSKTKLENGGISYIYTREDLRRMQAHNLKDVLKSTYPFGYSENNFGLSDPYNMGTPVPFLSSSLKIYIDNQEVSSGLYGSGVIIYGDMDIDFVDHIEVYASNPTLEFSTEPAQAIIKLYSKVAQKDSGSKVTLGTSSYGAKRASFYNTKELDNGWSYFGYISGDDNKRKKYHNRGSSLSKDVKNIHIFGTYYNANNHIMIDGITQKRDSFIAQSIFATPKDSTINIKYMHLGYDGNINNWYFLSTLDRHDANSNFEDSLKTTIQGINFAFGKNLPYQLSTKSTSEVYTFGIKNKLHFAKDKLTTGVKYRYKHFVYDQLVYNDIPLPTFGNTHQITSTAFMENQYFFRPNQIFTAGVSYSKVTNNNSPQNDNLLIYRLGYTFTNEKWVSKTLFSHIESSLDPYLINSIYLQNPYKKTPKEKLNAIVQDIRYEVDSNAYEIILAYAKAQNRLIVNSAGSLYPNPQQTAFNGISFRYTKNYGENNKLEITTEFNKMYNVIPSKDIKHYRCYLKSFNSFGKFDIFNELLYSRNSWDDINSFDYDATVIYHINRDLSISLKGTNLLNKAHKMSYMKLNPSTLQVDTPLEISPIDRKVMLNAEWTF